MRSTERRTRGIWMIALIIMLLGMSSLAVDFDHTHKLYDSVLKAHVVNGLVNYNTLKSDSKALDQYLADVSAVSEVTFKSWDEPRRIAFLANLYNASTLRMILDNYPVKSIKDIGTWRKGPWDQPVVRLFAKKITLNNLEHDILRKEYKEPRLHLALVCAAKGCPPLRSEAYTWKRLGKQLDDQARVYLASPAGLVINRKKGIASISSIFKWYGKDFSSVPSFVEKYSKESTKQLKIRYLDYDWSLNGK